MGLLFLGVEPAVGHFQAVDDRDENEKQPKMPEPEQPREPGKKDREKVQFTEPVGDGDDPIQGISRDAQGSCFLFRFLRGCGKEVNETEYEKDTCGDTEHGKILIHITVHFRQTSFPV